MSIFSSLNTNILSVAIVAGALNIVAIFDEAAAGPFCETSLCRSGESYRSGGEDSAGAYGVCQSSSGFGYTSHYLARCEDGWTLDIGRGVCVRDACAGGGVCGALVPLCMPTERYSRSASDGEGDYGVCESGPAPVTLAESHRIERCGEGWTLLTDTGLCRRTCTARIDIDPGLIMPTPIPGLPGIDPELFNLKPDLVIRRLWLVRPPATRISYVTAGSPYYLCYEVRNQGRLASGIFKVRSGGLGIPTPPEQRQASLAPGASREGCLYYSVTPQSGRYTVEATADADNTVVESRENNNDRRITYDVR